MADSEVELDVSGRTHVGRERARNEDQFLIAQLERQMHVVQTSVPEVAPLIPAPRQGWILMVADGMGGGAAGDVASAVAVKTIVNYLCDVIPWSVEAPSSTPQPRSSLPGVRSGLTSALRQGDAAVRSEARRKGTRRMGTTATIAYVQWPHLYVAHVGDSRCYLLRGVRLQQLTTDHTLAEQLKDRIDMTIDESSPWHHVLWNALGASDGDGVEPEVHRVRLELDDVLLLCSDGLNKHVDDQAITACLRSSPTAAAACERLVDEANAGGGSDNITAVVCYAESLEAMIDSDAPTVAVSPIDAESLAKLRRTED